jgi:hypothetical protein
MFYLFFNNHYNKNTFFIQQGRFDAAGPMRYLEPSSTLRSWMIVHPRNVEEGQYK